MAVGTTSYLVGKKTAFSLYAVKLDNTTGTPIWVHEPRDPKTTSSTELRGVAIDANGDAVITGTLFLGSKAQGIARKLRGSDGTVLATHLIPKGFLYNVAFDADGTPVVAGRTNSFANAIKFSPPTAGKSIVLKQVEGKPTKSSLKVQAADPDFILGVPGLSADPTVTGATLRLGNPTSGENQLINLPAIHWSGSGNPPGAKSYKYADPSFTSGPCTAITLKPGKWAASCSGFKLAFTLDEPLQETLGVTLQTGSQSSCVLFGGTVIKDVTSANGGKGVFQAKTAPPPATCP